MKTMPTPMGALAQVIPIGGFRYSTDGVEFHGFSEGTPRLCVDQPLYLVASNARQLTWQWDFGNGDTLHQEIGDKGPDTLV